MEIIKMKQLLISQRDRKRAVDAMVAGGIFVYPTDTVYGLGCNAEFEKGVIMIKMAKGSDEAKRFSVIAPGKEWIWGNSVLSKENRSFIDTILPGPYTVVVNAGSKAPRAVVSEDGTIGIRIPRHPFSDIVREAGVPLVSTSLNLSGEEPVQSIKQVPDRIKAIANWAVDDGKLEGSSSRVFDLRGNAVKILRY